MTSHFAQQPDQHTAQPAAPVQAPQNLLTEKTEAWIRNSLFRAPQWTPQQKDQFIEALNRALQSHDPRTLIDITLDGGASGHRAYLMLNSVYMLMTSGKPLDYKGDYYMTASKIERFRTEYLPIINRTAVPVKEMEIVRPGPAPVAPAGQFAQVSFQERTETPEQKMYIRLTSGGHDYVFEFDNPAKLPKDTTLPVAGYSITAIALNYGASRVTKLTGGVPVATYDLSNIPQAQELSKSKVETALVEAREISRDTMLATSRFEITTKQGSFYVETPRLNEKGYQIIKTAFGARQSPEEALKLLLSTAGARISTTTGAELAREEALRMVREETTRIAVVATKPLEATG